MIFADLIQSELVVLDREPFFLKVNPLLLPVFLMSQGTSEINDQKMSGNVFVYEGALPELRVLFDVELQSGEDGLQTLLTGIRPDIHGVFLGVLFVGVKNDALHVAFANLVIQAVYEFVRVFDKTCG